MGVFLYICCISSEHLFKRTPLELEDCCCLWILKMVKNASNKLRLKFRKNQTIPKLLPHPLSAMHLRYLKFWITYISIRFFAKTTSYLSFYFSFLQSQYFRYVLYLWIIPLIFFLVALMILWKSVLYIVYIKGFVKDVKNRNKKIISCTYSGTLWYCSILNTKISLILT